tara:strand:+ start:1082 stop:1525 length:444 start_codon:yes stop_codon:yes gene_type:complete
MKTKIEELLSKTLPDGTFIKVKERKHFDGEPYLAILWHPSDHQINNVKGQYPQVVSLRLDTESMDLMTQCFGGMGGQRIYKNPDPEHPKEKYLAMVGIKIPFRKPKKEEKFVLNAIKKFSENYIKLMRENIEDLRYKDLINYEEYLK